METTTQENPSSSKSAAARRGMSYGDQDLVMTRQVESLRSELRDHSQDMAQVSVGLIQERQKLIQISKLTTDALQKSQKSYQDTLQALNAQQAALLKERLAVLERSIAVVEAGQQQMQKALEGAANVAARIETKASEINIAADNMRRLFQKETMIPIWLSFGLGIVGTSLCFLLWTRFMTGGN